MSSKGTYRQYPGIHHQRGGGYAVLVVVIGLVILAILITYPLVKKAADARRAVEMAEVLMDKGNEAMVAGTLDDAIFAYMRASETAPGLPGVHLALGKAFMMDGRGDEAINAVSLEVEGNTDSLEAHLMLGLLYILKASGDDPLGAYLAKEMPEAMGFPGTPPGRSVFSQGGDYPLTEALFHFKYAEDIAPHEVRAGIGLAVMKALQGDHGEAESRFTDLLERAPDNAFVADALVRIPSLVLLSRPSPPVGQPGVNPWTSPGLVDDGTLPPIDTDWVEMDPDAPGTEGGPKEPPDVSTEASMELPSPSGDVGSGIPNATDPLVDSNGDIIITPSTLRKEPKTRPVGPVMHAIGDLSVPKVKIGNLYLTGQVELLAGESGIVPGSDVEVKILRIEGDNTVVLLEDGEEYTWIRGKVEWVLKKKSEESESSGDETSTDENGDE